MSKKPIIIDKNQAKEIWLQAQGLHKREPFGLGKSGTLKTIKNLGHVQIDTINVIERAHHHIFATRVPNYKKKFLHDLQTVDKKVYEHWTHALSFLPTEDFKYSVPLMKKWEEEAGNGYYKNISKKEIERVLDRIEEQGPISIQDVKDDLLVEKDHEWASKKPSKRVLSFLFMCGKLVISERIGMLKKYELTTRHFGWDDLPDAATSEERDRYLLQRGLRSQGFVTLGSLTHQQRAYRKKSMQDILTAEAANGNIVPIKIRDVDGDFWISSKKLSKPKIEPGLVHLLSPFDPLVIQRERFFKFFGHDYRFEAYLPKPKRTYGYFALPVLLGMDLVALIDLKTDRHDSRLLVQQWTWMNKFKSASIKKSIEQELNRFEKFQLAP